MEEKENGNLIIEFKVTQEMEVKSLIETWIPDVNVISPLSLQEDIENKLQIYLQGL